jgi:hypothetical protein
MQQHLNSAGEQIEEFEFYRKGYLLHIGGGTLDRISATTNEASTYFSWSQQAETGHYHGNSNGPAIVAAVRSYVLGGDVSVDGERLVQLCRQSARLTNLFPELEFEAEP